ncbi:MAG: TrkH family potassium uptake protein [Bacteroidales bacterium]|nr:TrkH family potassium uptake protein [Bacteroidales bacterium]MCI1785804.1 TrkH family potassium uptake protein [Bacteroidales bacterium]
MNVKVISRNVGFALLVSALFMFLSILVSVSNPNGNDSALAALTISFIITFIVGVFPFIFVRKSDTISLQDGYMIIFLSWLLSFIFGMLPYALWGGPFSVINALFESVSGFTTTGATILDNVEVIPKSLLFWRSSTHFIGGLGVVVFLLLIIPSSSPTRLRLTNMELSSLSREGYRSRANKMVLVFANMYFGLTFAAFVCYLLCGMSVFDAVNHAFSVVATGGFSTKNMSIAYFHSIPIDIVTMVFMVLSSIHFGFLFLAIVTRSLKPLDNPIIKYYLFCLAAVSIVVSIMLHVSGTYSGWAHSFLSGSFQVISMASATGFAITDNSSWPLYISAVILFVMIQGGCAGSTCGGVKCDRTFVLFKALGRQIRSAVHPNVVREVKIGNNILRDDAVSKTVLYIALYFILIFISSGICLLSGVDADNSVVATVSALETAGPAVGRMGFLGNYNSISVVAKLTLIIDMFLGRVEIYPVFAAMSLIFSRRKRKQ